MRTVENDLRHPVKNSLSKRGPASRWEIFAGVGLFLFLGLLLIFMDLRFIWYARDITLASLFFAILFILPVTGTCVGWIKSFPRWSYPYVGVSLLIGLYFMNASTPGISFFGYQTFGRELWGWRSWIPLGVAVFVALIITRSFEPIKQFFTNGWRDWTLFTFGMFGWIPLLSWVAFDEVDNLYTLYFTIGLNIVTVLSAYAYMRSTQTWQRTLSLGVGIVIPVVVASAGSTLYWLENGWVSIPGMVKAGLYVVLVMFSPVFIGILSYAGNPSPSEWEYYDETK